MEVLFISLIGLGMLCFAGIIILSITAGIKEVKMKTILSDWDRKLLVEVSSVFYRIQRELQIPESLREDIETAQEYIKEVLSDTYIAQV